MAKIVITDDKGETLESDTFVAVTIDQEGEMLYTKAFSSLRHLGLSGHLVAATALAEALVGTIREATQNSGADLLFEETELLGERKEEKDKEDDDGSSRAP